MAHESEAKAELYVCQKLGCIPAWLRPGNRKNQTAQARRRRKMPCKSSHLPPSLELKPRILEETGSETEPDPDLDLESETATDRGDLWHPLAAWLLGKKRLKGARLIIGAMEAWAMDENILKYLFGMNASEIEQVNLLVDFPVASRKWEMTDFKTVHGCLERCKCLENKRELHGLDSGESAELAAIKKYLQETTFSGRPRPFSDECRLAIKRNRNAVLYTLCILTDEDPELAEYARKHLRTAPVLHWLD